MQRLQDVVRITGRCGETGVLKAIDTRCEPAPDFFRAMRVRNDRQFVRVGFVHDRLHFFHRHLVLIDKLDDVHSGVRKLFHLRLAIGCAFYTPPELLGAGIRFVLKKWAGDVKGWSRNFAAVDPIPQANALLERTAEIARAGDSSHE